MRVQQNHLNNIDTSGLLNITLAVIELSGGFYVSRSSKTEGRFNQDTLTGLIGDDAKSFTLTPYAVAFPENSEKMSDDWEAVGEPFTITLP